MKFSSLPVSVCLICCSVLVGCGVKSSFNDQPECIPEYLIREVMKNIPHPGLDSTCLSMNSRMLEVDSFLSLEDRVFRKEDCRGGKEDDPDIRDPHGNPAKIIEFDLPFGCLIGEDGAFDVTRINKFNEGGIVRYIFGYKEGRWVLVESFPLAVF